VKDFLTKKGMVISGNFVKPPVEESQKKRFELNEERIEQVAAIV
jgi:hypothetical protein